MARERQPLLDSEWAGKAFLAPLSSLSDEVDERRRYFTSSSRKFVSAAIGGHFCVNPIPQFTENCDITHDAFFNKGIDSASRWWSEVLDDNAQYIHFRPGVPKFNSLTTFFGNFYNVNMGSITRSGRAPGLAYAVGRVLGTIGSLPLQPFILGGAIWRNMFNMPRGKYYYLSPTTYPYRFAVQTMMNAIMANLGMIAGSIDEETSKYYDNNVLPTTVDEATINRAYGGVLKRYGFMNNYGGIDVFAISTSAARLAVDFRGKLETSIESAMGSTASRDAPDNGTAKVWRRTAIDTIIANGVEANLASLEIRPSSLYEFEKAYESFTGSTNDDDDWANSSLFIPSTSEDDPDQGRWSRFKAYVTDSYKQFKSERDRGADFVTFRANWTGSQTDSFGNQSGDSSLSTKINSLSSRAREIRFNMADGNLVGGLPGEVLGFVGNKLKDLVSGALDSFQLSGAIALAGSAFADIQKMYQSSSADLNRTTFTMHLRSWSADDFVRIQNLYLPLAHIACLGLPRATGPGSYDGPFLVEVVNQGKTMIREGLVESITFERGVGDVGFGRNMEVLGIDVSVTVADLSSILSVPISGGVNKIAAAASGAIGVGTELITGVDANTVTSAVDSAISAVNKHTYGEDNKYTDWLATISSLPLESIIDPKRKWQLNMSRMRSDLASQRSPYNLGSKAFSLLPGEFVKVIFGETVGRY